MVDYPLIREWFRHADDDYTVAKHLLYDLYPVQIEIICFHCQQATEKWLKGYLVYKGIDEPPKTHDLNKLRDMCADFDDSFCSLSDQLRFLTRFTIAPRYPDEWEVGANDASLAVNYATEINNFAPLAELRKLLDEY
ncbi:MAG: HEPN domain-containing protein [Oscillospiraceae bacterium]|jgi:HEPN domain-containing protein|nr:HEPN domain-containing protein [Oscillospiraceae bacterium]